MEALLALAGRLAGQPDLLGFYPEMFVQSTFGKFANGLGTVDFLTPDFGVCRAKVGRCSAQGLVLSAMGSFFLHLRVHLSLQCEPEEFCSRSVAF